MCSSIEENIVESHEMKSYMLSMCHWMDNYFIKNVFKYTTLAEEANTYCDQLNDPNGRNVDLDQYGGV